ncbi:hypothetical protein C8Q69DRAFT_508482 [Paecilomyces variotii]|uniref:Uncharacterized protein n=1 Tax=Byssochlamys spectabilis TaxID=264951 RepID=A0A443HQL5_BYSSP|nr:hypothetical protein C8Q69DRAFT_508482 [Paecilomyces variotii]RWQ94138.1 hypothetical protein C8Q69DRAFT_508482 [Paecilomyces variotii]
MSATVSSKIVHFDEIIPRVVDPECEEKDVERLIPLVFKYTDVASENIPKGCDFHFFFYNLLTYHAELQGLTVVQGGVRGALREKETISLLKKNWRVEERRLSDGFIRSQGMMLRVLMTTIYSIIDIRDPTIQFPIRRFQLEYMIGRERYLTRPEGAVSVNSPELPIISYTGWFEGQTWRQFLEETLSVMIGQLVGNIKIQDKSSWVHSKGCHSDEIFQLNFTRGYDLCLKEDWLEATRALARLFRYLLSGNAKVGAVQAYSQPGADADKDV